MAVTPAGRNYDYDQKIRDQREEYENREEEIQKKRAEDVKRLEKRHAAELKKVTDEYQSRLDEVQKNNRQTLTEKDVRHQGAIEDLKSVYNNQLRKKMEENVNQRRSLEESYRSDLEKQKQVVEGQRANLSEKQAKVNTEKDDRLNQVMDEARRGMTEAIDRNREKLNTTHDKEKSLLVKERNEALARKDFESREVVKALRGEIVAQKQGREADNARWNQKYYDTVKTMGDATEENHRTNQQVLRDAIENQQERYHSKLAEKLEQFEDGNERFQSDVSERQNTQVRSRDSQIMALNSKLNNERMNAERQKNLEKRNLTQSYEARWKDLEEQKEGALETMKDLAQSRVNNVINKNDQVMRNANREYRSQMALVTGRNREDRNMLMEQQKDQLTSVKNSADKRIKTLTKMGEENQRLANDHYQEALEDVRSGYAEKVDEQRDRHLADQGAMMNAMNERFRSIENRFQNKYEQTVESYETKIVAMKERHEKEMKYLQNSYDQRIKEREKGFRQEKGAIEQKYEAKLAMQGEQHEQNLERVQKRHEEDLKSVAERAKTYSRKA